MALDIVAWFDHTSADHQTQYNNARAAGYSTAPAPSLRALRRHLSGDRAWNVDGVDDDIPTLQSRFNALVSGFARPVKVAATPVGSDLMMYDDSQMPFWQAWDGISGADFQAKFDALYPQGLRPIRVSAKGTGGAARRRAVARRLERGPWSEYALAFTIRLAALTG